MMHLLSCILPKRIFMLSIACVLWVLCQSLIVTAFSTTARSTFGSYAQPLQRNSIFYRHHSLSKSTRQNNRRLRSNLQMHMGHSHSHHHHHDHSSDSSTSISISNIQQPKKSLKSKILFHLSHRGLIPRTLFAAIAILTPPLLFHKRPISKADMAIFILTSTVLSFAERIRFQTKVLLQKANQLKQNLIKHSPQVSVNPQNILAGNSKENEADRVTVLGAVINLILSFTKLFVGITCHSSALIADAGHSLSDLFSDFITLWAVQVARLPPDDDHPYGHGKFEAIGSLFLALTLFGTGLSVGAHSNSKLIQIISATSGGGGLAAAAAAVEIPTFPALIMAGLSIASKEWLYRITRRVGEKINSQVVIANAWHHRSDAYSSVLALLSIGLAMAVPGMLAADSAAGLLVAGMICMTGFEIMGESVKQLTDTSDEKIVQRIKKLAKTTDDILEVKRIRARWMGSAAIVDVAVTTRDSLSSSALRAVEERLKFKIMEKYPGSILDVDVHATCNEVVCPLLTATGALQVERKSAVEVEDYARNLLLGHKEVQSVEGCTVHYKDTLLANVDAHVKLNNPNETTIHDATLVAKELRSILEKSNDIDKANIFLDLNENVPSLRVKVQ